MNLTTIEELILKQCETMFTTPYLANKLGISQTKLMSLLLRLKENGFIRSDLRTLTKKGITYVDTFVKVDGEERQTNKSSTTPLIS